METVYKSSKVIIGFLVLVFLVQTAFGQKASQYFVLLVLFSIMILNSGNFISFMNSTFTTK